MPRFRRRRVATLTACGCACLALPAGAAALGGGTPIVIDDFSTTQATLNGAGTTAGSVSGAGILGGERDAVISGPNPLAATLAFPAGRISLDVPLTSSAVAGVTWDGPGVDSVEGLGGVDLTAAGTQNAVRVRLTPGGIPPSVALMVASGPAVSSGDRTPAAAGSDVDLVIPFSALSAGADFGEVDRVRLTLAGGGLLGAQASVDQITTDAVVRGDLTATLVTDVNGDGLAGPGDEIQVEVKVANPADAGGFPAPGTSLTIAQPPGTAIIPESVVGSAGVGASVPAPGTVLYTLGEIADGADATVALRLRVLPTVPPQPVVVQGTIAGDGLTALPTTSVAVPAAPNAAPVATADAYTHTGFLALVVPGPGVLANDTDPDGDAMVAAIVDLPTRGQLGFAADGSFVYVPTFGLTGVDTFTYRALDGRGGSSLATVTITVLPPQAPAPPGGGPPATPAPTTPPAFTCVLPGRRTTLNLPPTVSQLRINQRIAIAAIRRLNSVRARLDGRPQPVVANKPAGRIRATTQQLRINQRISEAGFVRAKAIYDRLGGRRSPTLTPLARTIVLNRGGVGANQLTNIRALDMLNCINRNLR